MQREEKILVCLSGSPTNARVVRAAAKIAEAFHGTLTALFVEPANYAAEPDSRLAENIRLAKQLGAQIRTLYGDDAAAVIAEYARVSGSTKIVIGRSPGKRGIFSKKSIVDRLGELASDIDIYIIPDKSETSDTPRGSARSQEQLSLRDALITAVMLAFCTGIGYLFSDLGFSTANVIVIYIIGVLGIAMLTAGRSYSLAASILSVLICNFFFTEPYYDVHRHVCSGVFHIVYNGKNKAPDASDGAQSLQNRDTSRNKPEASAGDRHRADTYGDCRAACQAA